MYDKLVYPMLANTMFDETAIRAASAAVKLVQPDAAPFLMLTTDAELHQMQNAMFDDPAANQGNRDYLKSLWKYMQESEGSGKIEGAPDADRAVRTWDALTAKQKMAYLDGLMLEAVTGGVSKLLKQ